MSSNLPARRARRESPLISLTEYVIELGGVPLGLGELEAVHEALNRLVVADNVTPRMRAYARNALMMVDAELERVRPCDD